MIIYNVTVNVDDSVHSQWLEWMQKTHIPNMLATGKFTNARLVKVLADYGTEGTTYSVQYTVKDRQTLNSYYEEDALRLRQEALALFADKFVAFRTELEVISEH